MKQVIKVRIYAGKDKMQRLKQSIRNSRFVWNKFVDLEKEHYERTGKFLWFADLCREITKMKKEYPFLNESSIWGLQQIARKFHFALKEFVKHKNEGYGFPSYKRKSRYEGIVIYPRDFKFKDNKLYLPKIGWVKIKDKITKKEGWQKIINTAKQVWIKESVDGFFAYIVYDRDKEKKNKSGRIAGIDVGIKNTITLSTGEVYSLPKKEIMKLKKEIEKLQSIIDKKREINGKRGIKYSKRIEKLRMKLNKRFKKIEDIKSDFYHKTINHILNNHECVVVEDLDLKKLHENREIGNKASRKIHKYLDCISLSDFYRILEYKAEFYGRKIIKVNSKDTSKTCSTCGYVYHELKLSDRTFKCPKCGFKIDRDLNASINILKRGLEHTAPSPGHGEYMREMSILNAWAIRRTPQL